MVLNFNLIIINNDAKLVNTDEIAIFILCLYHIHIEYSEY